MPDLLSELRRKAALCRAAAGIPTQGGGRADRAPRQLAAQFDREAAAFEETNAWLRRSRPQSAENEPESSRLVSQLINPTVTDPQSEFGTSSSGS